MNKLLTIVGPTATGKTKYALKLAAQKPSLIISADSRQVYRGMDIVTGKDHPQNIKIFGINILDPDETCSVSVWYDAVTPHMQKAWGEGKQVIVVGGTGLYVRALTHGIETIRVPINHALRAELDSLSVNELQKILKAHDPDKFANMNNSDKHNPRRLIRAIEVVHNPHESSSVHPRSSTKVIGLRYYDNSNYSSKVRQRVVARLKSGAIEETKQLLSRYDRGIQSLSAIGYKSIISYLDKKTTKSEMIESWVSDELSYAKRQMTWFRKQEVIWYDIDRIQTAPALP